MLNQQVVINFRKLLNAHGNQYLMIDGKSHSFNASTGFGSFSEQRS